MNINPVATLPAPADPQLFRRALAWMRERPAEDRARATSALARAYLCCSLSAPQRADALLVMTAALDDGSMQVRRALSEALASATEAPRHLIAALIADCGEVARPVLANSPLLDDVALAEAAVVGDAHSQTIIARRAKLGARTTWAIADGGDRAAALALVENLNSTLDSRSLGRIFDRFVADSGVCEALLRRGSLPATLKLELAMASAETMADLGKTRGWIEPGVAERASRDLKEQAIIFIAKQCAVDELAELVDHLRNRGYLTVALLMRSLFSGDVSVFELALANLSGVPASRVAGFLRQYRGRGFSSLYAKAELPPSYLPAFRAALAALARGAHEFSGGVSRSLAEQAIAECEALCDPALQPVISLMWRLAGEGAREEARGLATEVVIAAETALAVDEIARELAVDFGPLLSIDAAPLLIEPPRLDFGANEAPEAEDHAPPLPDALDFTTANENAAPPIELDFDEQQALEVAA